MQVVKLKFRELELVKTDFLHDRIWITLHYEENKQERELEKIFDLDENIANFVKNLMNDVKQDAKKRYYAISQDEYEFLSGIVNIVLEEHEPGFTEIRMIDAVRRLKDKIGFFRKVKSASNYMSSYHDLNETRIKL